MTLTNLISKLETNNLGYDISTYNFLPARRFISIKPIDLDYVQGTNTDHISNANYMLRIRNKLKIKNENVSTEIEVIESLVTWLSETITPFKLISKPRFVRELDNGAIATVGVNVSIQIPV